MRHRPARRILAQFLLAVMLVACGGNGAVQEAGRGILVLGVMGTSDSENPAIVGMIRGVEQAVAEYNGNDDSRYEIELKEFNTQATPGEAGAGESEIANTERLIGVVGPFVLGEVESLAPAFENSGLPYLVPSVTATGVPQNGWRNFRRLIANDGQEGAILASHAADRVGGAIALVTEDSPEGAPFAEAAKAELDRLQRSASRTDTIEPGETPTTLATAIAGAAPEAVLYGGGGATGKALLDALRAAEFAGLTVASHQMRDMHPAGVGGRVVSSSPGAGPAGARAARFAGRFENRFDSPPPPFALEAYEGALMLLEAAEEVQGDLNAIAEFLRTNRKFRGDSKNYEFDDRGELVSPPVWVYESTNGGWRLAGPSDRTAG